MHPANLKRIPTLEPTGAPVSLSAFLKSQSPLPANTDTPRPVASRRPLGQILLEMGAISPGNLLKALALRNRQDVRLGDILLSHGWVSDADLMAGLARQWKATVVDLLAERPDPRLIDAIGPEACLKHGMVPWRRIGGATIIATSRPEHFRDLTASLPDLYAPYRMVLAPERDVHDSLLSRRQTALIRRAEVKVDPAESCRTRNEERASRIAFGTLAAVTLGLWIAPIAVFALLFGWVMLTLIAAMGLKAAAFLAELIGQRRDRARTPETLPARLPIISVMVPLFRENDIAERLIARLGRLTYPKELLDILLVVEEDDHTTRRALDGKVLPRWMRVVTVPTGPIKTKPRALNYALSFCRGSVIGVYDAEDAPDPEQLHTVARRFAETGPEVACVQGILDYYNPRTNWLSRCFTIEYAGWFRLVLPGLARLGLVVPLGGTTLFFRREVLDRLGAWDAHNVTEDADLGIRLARHGFRTELIDTVTHEEANCRPLPWIKQRSRWIKGYMMTWAVHMRQPRLLWQQLGAKGFLGFQVLFLGTIAQFLLAPLLWSFLLLPFGFDHPLYAALPVPAVWAIAAVFFLSEAANILIGALGLGRTRHGLSLLWVLTLKVYYPLASLAAYKGLVELATRPFYWDKTTHGLFDHMDAKD